MKQTVFLYEEKIPEIVFAANELKRVWERIDQQAAVTYVPIQQLSETTAPVRVILTTLEWEAAQNLLRKAKDEAIAALVPQGYAIRKEFGADYTAWWVIGCDAAGAMYGAIDMADALKAGKRLRQIGNEIKNPY